MKEFIIDETYEQICINCEGNIEISGLTEKDARHIGKDANSAGMNCRIFVHAKDRAVITIEVEFNAVILKGKQLSVPLNSSWSNQSAAVKGLVAMFVPSTVTPKMAGLPVILNL